jgi:hypothetical protein
MGTKTKRRLAPAFTSSDALLFNYIRKVELRLVRLAPRAARRLSHRRVA